MLKYAVIGGIWSFMMVGVSLVITLMLMWCITKCLSAKRNYLFSLASSELFCTDGLVMFSFCRDVDVVDVFILYIAILRVKVLNKVQQKHGLFKIILALLCVVGIIKPDFCNWEHCPNTFSSFKDMIVRNMEGWKTKMETLLAILANGMLSLLLISHEYHSRSNEQQAVKLNYNVKGLYKIKRKYIRLYSTT